MAMRNTLVRCGLNETTADYVIVDQGINSTEELLMSSKENFNTMVKNAIKLAPANVTFSYVSIRRLNALSTGRRRWRCVDYLQIHNYSLLQC